MGRAAPFSPASLFCGVIYADAARLPDVQAELAARWSPVEFVCPPVPFDFTRYYEAEMGTPLFRTFWAFARPIDPAALAGCKRFTDQVELNHARDGRRTVNLDPGYLNQHQLVIATTKNHAHRIALTDGIYAHLELLFQKDRPQPLPWTYPDFRGDAYHPFFLELRRRHAAATPGGAGI